MSNPFDTKVIFEEETYTNLSSENKFAGISNSSW